MAPPTVPLLERLARRFARQGQAAIVRPVEIDASPLEGRRTLTVYLPPGYDDVPGKSWPLLVAHDGQEMSQWKLREALTRHHALGGDTPVVAALAAGPRRMDDYGTAGVANAQGLGARAQDFQSFVVETVIPRLRRRYRLRNGAAHTAVMGASLGGLSAFDLAWNHPDVFGIAGVFSGSFWWRTDDVGVAAQQASRVVHRRVRKTSGRPDVRFWLQTGTRDEASDRDGNGVIDAIQDTTELIDALEEKGFRRNHDVAYREVINGEHTPATWAMVLPEFLVWAFPRQERSTKASGR